MDHLFSNMIQCVNEPALVSSLEFEVMTRTDPCHFLERTKRTNRKHSGFSVLPLFVLSLFDRITVLRSVRLISILNNTYSLLASQFDTQSISSIDGQVKSD